MVATFPKMIPKPLCSALPSKTKFYLFESMKNSFTVHRSCPTCQSVIHIADNKVTPRDLLLLNKVTKPVRMLTCQVDDAAGVNPQLLNIADKTGGSLHTLDEDVTNLSRIAVGERIPIAQRTYRRTSTGFVLV